MKKVNLTAYTDAASYNNGKKNFKDPENSSSFGIIIYDRKTLCRISLYNPDTSISFGELFAIHNTIKWCYDTAIKTEHLINLVLYTDSAYSFQSITQWMEGWKKKEVDGKWFNSSGKRVAYQTLLSEIDRYINSDNINVNIKHISGHINLSNQKDIKKARDVFKRFNNEPLSDYDLAKHVFYNDICDKSAKEFLKLGMRGDVNSSYEGNERLYEKYFS